MMLEVGTPVQLKGHPSTLLGHIVELGGDYALVFGKQSRSQVVDGIILVDLRPPTSDQLRVEKYSLHELEPYTLPPVGITYPTKLENGNVSFKDFFDNTHKGKPL